MADSRTTTDCTHNSAAFIARASTLVANQCLLPEPVIAPDTSWHGWLRNLIHRVPAESPRPGVCIDAALQEAADQCHRPLLSATDATYHRIIIQAGEAALQGMAKCQLRDYANPKDPHAEHFGYRDAHGQCAQSTSFMQADMARRLIPQTGPVSWGPQTVARPR